MSITDMHEQLVSVLLLLLLVIQLFFNDDF